MTGKLNSRVTFKKFGAVQDAGGGVSSELLNSYTVWAKVEDRNGATVTSEAQTLWNYDYKITVRHADWVKSNLIIEYDDNVLQVQSVSFNSEGRRKFVVCRCSAIDGNV